MAEIRRRFDGRKLGRYEKSDSVHKTGKDMDVQLRNVKRLAEVVENMGKMQLEEVNEEKGKIRRDWALRVGSEDFMALGTRLSAGAEMWTLRAKRRRRDEANEKSPGRDGGNVVAVRKQRQTLKMMK